MEINQQPYTLPWTEVHTLTASKIEQEYHIAVAFPRGYGGEDKTYPVLYAMDAIAGFGTTVEGQRLMSLMNEVSDVLIVGVGYPMQDYAETRIVRTRDLTPTFDPDYYEEHLKEVPVPPGGDLMGGAEEFFTFLNGELFPFIQERYRVDQNDRGILGISFGGLFATYCLFKHPGCFQRYIIGSPSLWWDNGVVFEYEKEYTSEHSDLAAKVFLSVGGLEGDDRVNVVKELGEVLDSRGYQSLELTRTIFEGETHLSVGGATIWHGLRETYRLDPA
jgi:predicted alpha/beta superfamily hydrolase